MGLFDFMASSPWLTFFLAVIIAQAVTLPFRALFRHLNIRKAGWPPAHCDAGGNLIEKD